MKNIDYFLESRSIITLIFYTKSKRIKYKQSNQVISKNDNKIKQNIGVKLVQQQNLLFYFPQLSNPCTDLITMSKNLSLQRQLHALSQQNQMLRVKAQKIHEIQSYVNILIQSSQSSQQQLSRSHQQNRSLKIKIDQLMADLLKLQQNYQHQFNFMQTEFKRQLLKKDQDLRLISSTREKQSQHFQQKLSENQVRSKNDIQRLKLQYFSFQKQCQQQISKLNSLLSEKSTQLQLSQESKNLLKKTYLEQSNNISTQIAKLQRAYHQSQDQVFFFQQQLAKLSKLLDQLTASQNMLKRQLTRKQDQIISDKKSNDKKIRLLQENLNQVTAKQKKTIQKLNESSLQNEKLLKELNSLSQQNNDIKLYSSKLERLINEKDQQIKQLTLKIQQEEEQHKRYLKRHNEQLKRVEQELNLASERFLCEKRNSDGMKGEIQDLLKVIDKLQANLTQSNHNLQMINKQNSVLFREVENVTKELKYKIEELNDMDEKYKQLRENSLMLQGMYKKQSIKSQTLNKQNVQIIARLESITREQKALQEHEVSNLIEKHLSQKRQMLQTHRIQKQNLGKRFEQALREKDEQAKKRFQLFEDQINLMRIRH